MGETQQQQQAKQGIQRPRNAQGLGNVRCVNVSDRVMRFVIEHTEYVVAPGEEVLVSEPYTVPIQGYVAGKPRPAIMRELAPGMRRVDDDDRDPVVYNEAKGTWEPRAAQAQPQGGGKRA